MAQVARHGRAMKKANSGAILNFDGLVWNRLTYNPGLFRYGRAKENR